MAVAGEFARARQSLHCRRGGRGPRLSALKRAYRRYLRVNADVKLVFLRGEYELIANQLRHRRAHFMNPALLQSQFADLEEPQATEASILIELGQGPHKLVQELKRKLRIRR